MSLSDEVSDDESQDPEDEDELDGLELEEDDSGFFSLPFWEKKYWK